jgi:hypothetical protein
MSDGGKGSKARPFSVSDAEYASRWDAIFMRDAKDEKMTMEMPGTIGSAKIVLKGEEALQKLHDENVKLGLYE